MDTYLIFDIPVRSQIALPELPVCAERKPAITITREVYDLLGDGDFTVRHDWRRDGGPIICSSARHGAQYRLSFPGRASFYIRPGAMISYSASPGVGEGVVRQLLLSQVIPRYLAHRGALLLHASAVTLPTGKTVAFLGDSGQGKSTLASYCQQHGAQLIDDDCILLRFERGHVSVVGGVPAIRLYPDSLHALGLRASGVIAPDTAATDKQQVLLEDGSSNRHSPRVLDTLLLIDQSNETTNDTAVNIRPATGQAAMMALLRGAFHLDPSDPPTMTRVFSQAGAVLSECRVPPVHHLYYPREHDRLPDVLQALLDFQSA